MLYGEAGSFVKYFQVAENPSFQYAMQMDCEEKIANIFWADSKMIVDYAHLVMSSHLTLLLEPTKNIDHLVCLLVPTNLGRLRFLVQL